ncbi:MAG: fumarate reductase (quinol) flavoprotein subunit [Planctomycetota bacterium]|nr:fumarate reductase (quinol) flavoprotein subunit [Planctomycetota bacterium]
MSIPVHDVLIVGGGGAGLRAAIAIAQASPDQSVAVVSKVYPMRSHTVSAEGGAAGVIKSDDSKEHHCNDTIGGGDWLADQDAVEMFVEEAPKELIQLEHWGCPWNREPDGSVAVRPFGGMKIKRTWFASDKTGFHMLHTLFQTSQQFDPVTRYDEHFAFDLLVHDGRCQGVATIDQRSGEMRIIGARAVILCTGGGGRIFPFTTNAAIKSGDGMALAYRAGVALKDMEFVQYHPTGLPGTGILITEAARGEGGILLNRHGRRYLQDHDLGTPLDVSDPRHPQLKSMELGPRDRLSQAFYWEREAGNVFEDEMGSYVHLDVRHLGEEKINKRIPFVRDTAKNYVGVDCAFEPIPVRPVVHYMMGGVDTDINAATSLPGLYAAGECACVSINGANRLGSNSLTELLVFGKRAGLEASRFARENPQIAIEAIAARANDEAARLKSLHTQGKAGEESIAPLRRELTSAMEEGAGIYRTQAKMDALCERIRELKARVKNLRVTDTSRTFNTQLVNALELDFMIDAAEALAFSAAARKESRGAHQRLDFRARDDDNYLAHSIAHRTDGDPKISYKDVTITRWPPKERVYGK